MILLLAHWVTVPAQGHPVNVPIRRTMHLSSVIPANDTRESVFGHRNFPRRERGSKLGPLFKALQYNNLFPRKERSFQNIVIPLTCDVLTWGRFDLAHEYCSSFRI